MKLIEKIVFFLTGCMIWAVCQIMKNPSDSLLECHAACMRQYRPIQSVRTVSVLPADSSFGPRFSGKDLSQLLAGLGLSLMVLVSGLLLFSGFGLAQLVLLLICMMQMSMQICRHLQSKSQSI